MWQDKSQNRFNFKKEHMTEISEKVILVGIQTGNGEDAQKSIEELKELARTAGAESVGEIIQARDFPHPATYLGAGKIEELRTLINETEATGVICDDELSPSQMKNLEDILDIKVMDRTVLILDIFAQRASTAEGKIQVELAQLQYSLTRLQGYGTSMSRLGGGIGTRGPGESKLESDRRVIRRRVAILNHELKEVVKHRDITRAGREQSKIPVIAIVGYTNAGKSTLLNRITNAEVLSEDKLFATLDPTTRVLKLLSGSQVLMTDTVGFINKLPHHLVDAFKSTLEEAKYADIVVHVVDASNPDYGNQMKVVYETLGNLGVSGKPVITLFNKMDKADDSVIYRDFQSEKSFGISAYTGAGIDKFLEELENIIRRDMVYYEGTIPFSEAQFVNSIRTKGELLSEEYTENGIIVKAYVPVSLFGKLQVIR